MTSNSHQMGGPSGRLLPVPAPQPSVAFVSTYPPTICGLATFTQSLREAYRADHYSPERLDVFDLTDGREPRLHRPEVAWTVDPADRFSVRAAAEEASSYDAVILQHEYGIWGPDMGRSVIDFVEKLATPLITTLHTVLTSPTPVQEEIIGRLWTASAYTVVPTRAARDLLAERYALSPRSIVVVPHGTDTGLRSVSRARSTRRLSLGAPQLLTWGLIGPGKGLEWAIRAVAQVREHYPDVLYTIAGRTHPKVLANEGEAYRDGLEALVSDLGLEGNVRFIDDYISPAMMRELLVEATLVVLPYDSGEQIVSGVLVEAVAANVPVVSTQFPHAVELSTDGLVSAVPHRNPDAIAEAVSRLLESPTKLDGMVEAQRSASPAFEWANVAGEYRRMVEAAVSRSAPMRHVSPAS